MVLTISKKHVPDFLDSLIEKNFSVIAPVKTENGVNFQRISGGEEAILDYTNTAYPPKNFFIPNGEILFRYDSKRGGVEDTVSRERRVIFGIRPCDVHGLARLDKVFMNEYEDPYYSQKRKDTIVIAVNCAKSGDNCFCQSMGTDRLEDGFDILLSETEEGYLVEDSTDRGRKIMKGFRRVSRAPRTKKMKNTRIFDSKNIEKRLLPVFGSPGWNKIAGKCLSCGACTAVCPTCYCFNVRDENEFGESRGVRKRIWDFCMLLDFSRVAGDVVFRRERPERCKQFVFHKLSYFKKEHGKQLCTGCGRCVDVCPTGIDFFAEAEKLLERGRK